MKTIYLIISLLMLTAGHQAQAHQLSTAYLTGTVEKNQFNGQYQIKVSDLAQLMALDVNGDGDVTWGEVKHNKTTINQWLQHTLTTEDNSDCQKLMPSQTQVDSHYNENYLAIDFTLRCQQAQNLAIRYNGVIKQLEGHKLLLSTQQAEQTTTALIKNEGQQFSLATQTGSSGTSFLTFIQQGVIHIWIGYDHILFVLCLLLAAFVLIKNQSTGQKIKEVTLLITTFTLAHSVTLLLTSLDLIQINSRWVEATIAATVFITAVNNITPFLKRIILLTFIFGLIHGMGFASVFSELTISSNANILAILFFNLGIELGQIGLILILFPLLLIVEKYLKSSQNYYKLLSAGIALIAVYWFIERI